MDFINYGRLHEHFLNVHTFLLFSPVFSFPSSAEGLLANDESATGVEAVHLNAIAL